MSALARSARDRVPGGTRGPAIGVALAAGMLGLLALAGRQAAARDPLRRAWSAAQAAGLYRVSGTTRAVTADGVAAYAVEGVGTAAGALTLTVRADTGPTVTYFVAWPRVTPLASTAGVASPAAMEPHAVALIFPAGDPLALVATGHGARAAGIASIGGRDCGRVDFLVAAPAYAAWWLRHRAWLPVNADAGGLHKFTAEGTVWLEAGTDRPCRIAARVDLPRLAGEQPGDGEVDWVYAGWGEPRAGR